jgi:hypothetical protein
VIAHGRMNQQTQFAAQFGADTVGAFEITGGHNENLS